MSFPTLEQVRTSLNLLQGTVVNDFYTLIDTYTGEYAYFRKITSAWTDAKCDGFMYIKGGTDYFERIITTPYLNVKWFGANIAGITGKVYPFNASIY
jgi:hypothetical protein